jgi:two-component system, response regulator PdtaR
MGPKILVVEDERITAEDIKSGLESADYEVLDMISTGEEAIEMAGKLQPDLVLMDIKLKGKMDGIEAAGQIKLKYDIPVIYLTAYSDEYTVKRAKKTDHSGFILKEDSGLIKKPFEESELRSAIEITLYRYKMEKEHDLLLSEMLKYLNEAVIATNPEGLIKLMNSSAEILTGCKLNEVNGNSLNEVFTPLNKFKTFDGNEMKEFLLKNDNVLKSSGRDMQVQCDLNVIRDDKGLTNGFILVFKKIE